LPFNYRQTPRSKLDEPGTTGEHVERSERQLLTRRELLDPLDQELQVGLYGTEIDVLGITSWHEGVVIVWHVDSRQSDGNGVSAKLRRSLTASPRSMTTDRAR
jgi:hypothetical protein